MVPDWVQDHAIAYLLAAKRRVSVRSIREIVRYWYTIEGDMVNAGGCDELMLPTEVEITDDHIVQSILIAEGMRQRGQI
jgi:hypothetical protein